MGPDAPWPRRLGGWTRERFPPVVYTLLVVLFHAAAVLVARGLTAEGGWAPQAAVVVWLVFLHLRVFDEHKDFEKDREAYPDRLLSRGVVTLTLLARVGAVVDQKPGAADMGELAILTWYLAMVVAAIARF